MSDGGGNPAGVWGYLLPLRDGPPPLELRQDTTSEGTADTLPLQVHPAVATEESPHTVLEVRRERDTTSAVLRSEVFALRVDRGAATPRGQWVTLEHGACVAFDDEEQSYVYVNRELSESFAAPQTVLTRYLVGHFLGSGGFGKLFTLFDKENNFRRRAMKIVEPTSEGQVPYAEREARILVSLEHPCVIKTISVEHLERQHFLIMEYMAGGDLGQFVNDQRLLSEQQTKLIFFQLALAMEYLHENDICHRDLKPANIILQERVPNTLIKVTDFGLAKCGNEDSSMKTFVGTKPYLAPEVIYGDKYTKSVDVWSMGVILFYSLTGTLPFANLNEAVNRHHVVEYHVSHWQHVSSDAFQLVRKMLQVNPADRVIITDMLGDLWLRDDAMRMDVFRLTGLDRPHLTSGSRSDYQSPWGYLLPLQPNLPLLELNQEQVTLGTADSCTVSLDASSTKLPNQTVFCSLSHDKHDNNAFLTSESNYVLLNDRDIPQRWKVPLEHGMQITFEKGKASYVYANRTVSTSLKEAQRYDKRYWVFDCASEGNIVQKNEYILMEKKPNHKEKTLKVVQVLPVEANKFDRKITKLLNLNHPCLLRIFSCERLQTNSYLIMDYMGGGDLGELVNSKRNLTEAETKLLFFQVALAVEYLHKRKITYRLLNPRNILLKHRTPHTLIKLSTLVFLNDSNEDRSTPESEDSFLNLFIAPDDKNPLAKEVDVYSMGIILLYSLTGYLPSENASADWQGVSEQARALVAAMMKQTPSARPSVSAVLKDPWLQDERMRAHAFQLTQLEELRPKLSRPPMSCANVSVNLCFPFSLLVYSLVSCFRMLCVSNNE